VDHHEVSRETRDASINSDANIKLELTVSNTDLPTFKLSDGWTYEFKQAGERIAHASAKIHEKDFSEFCKGLLAKIRSIEGDSIARVRLFNAYARLHTLASDEPELDRGICEFYTEIKKAYEQHEEDLPGFPVDIFSWQGETFNRERLALGRDMMLAAAGKKDGRPLTIFGADNLKGFVRDGTMLFHPIDVYNTHEREGQELRKKLEEYSVTPD
jgi:hypothetical protein